MATCFLLLSDQFHLSENCHCTKTKTYEQKTKQKGGEGGNKHSDSLDWKDWRVGVEHEAMHVLGQDVPVQTMVCGK